MMLTLRRLSSADLTALQEGPDEIVPLLRDVDGFEQVAATAEQLGGANVLLATL